MGPPPGSPSSELRYSKSAEWQQTTPETQSSRFSLCVGLSCGFVVGRSVLCSMQIVFLDAAACVRTDTTISTLSNRDFPLFRLCMVGAACLTCEFSWSGVCVKLVPQMSAPSNFLSVARVAAFFGGAVFGGIKMGSIAKEVKKSDLELVKEFDEEQAALPADKRSYLGAPM
jgi:hypothetical protein